MALAATVLPARLLGFGAGVLTFILTGRVYNGIGNLVGGKSASAAAQVRPKYRGPM